MSPVIITLSKEDEQGVYIQINKAWIQKLDAR